MSIPKEVKSPLMARAGAPDQSAEAAISQGAKNIAKNIGPVEQFDFDEKDPSVPKGAPLGNVTVFTLKNPTDVAENLRSREKSVFDPNVPVFLLQFAAVPEPERLIVTRFALESGLSADYRCEVEFTVFEGENQQDKLHIDTNQVLFEPAVLTVLCYQDEASKKQAMRTIHGIVTQFAHRPGTNLDEDNPSLYRRYRIVIEAPLAHEAWRVPVDCQIYQDVTVPEVLEELLARFKGKRGNVEWKLDNQLDDSRYPKHAYLVRWLETPYDFFKRLCGEAGIVHHFLHDVDRLTLRLIDKNPKAQDPKPLAQEFTRKPDATWVVTYDEREPEALGNMSGFELLSRGRAVPRVEVRDVLPTQGGIASANVDLAGRPEELQSFLHAGHGQSVLPDDAAQKKLAESIATLEAERIACRQEIYTTNRGPKVRSGTESAKGGLRSVTLMPGDILHFDPADSALDEPDYLAREYLVTRVTMSGSAPDPESESASGDEGKAAAEGDQAQSGGEGDGATSGGPSFWLDSDMIDLRRTFRPPIWNRKPDIGPQWGKITALEPKAPWYEDGNTARVRVMFPWVSSKEDLSCWVHHLQPSQYFQTPLIEGTWVLVAFVNNEADRPVIIGSAPSAGNKWHHGNDTLITGIKTQQTDFYLDDGAQTAVLTSEAAIKLCAKDTLDMECATAQVGAQKVLIDAPMIQLTGHVQINGTLNVAGGAGASFSMGESGISMESPVPVTMKVPRLAIDTVSPLSTPGDTAGPEQITAKGGETGDGDDWILRPGPEILIRNAEGVHGVATNPLAGQEANRQVAEAMAEGSGNGDKTVQVVEDEGGLSGAEVAILSGAVMTVGAGIIAALTGGNAAKAGVTAGVSIGGTMALMGMIGAIGRARQAAEDEAGTAVPDIMTAGTDVDTSTRILGQITAAKEGAGSPEEIDALNHLRDEVAAAAGTQVEAISDVLDADLADGVAPSAAQERLAASLDGYSAWQAKDDEVDKQLAAGLMG